VRIRAGAPFFSAWWNLYHTRLRTSGSGRESRRGVHFYGRQSRRGAVPGWKPARARSALPGQDRRLPPLSVWRMNRPSGRPRFESEGAAPCRWGA